MLVGLLYQLPYGRRTRLPPRKILIPLSLLFLAFAADGINSYLHFFPAAPSLYEPNNALRLATGTGLGLLIAVFLLPVVHQTLWADGEDRAAIERWPQVLVMLAAAGLAALALYSQNTIILYPLALASTAVIPLVLTLCYTLLWVIAFHRENSYRRLRDAWAVFLAGFTLAVLQIGLVDWLRYWLTGTWGGFQL